MKLSSTLELVAFSHSIFALPFALGAMWVAGNGWPGWTLLILIIVAMITARTTAMSFNRLIDRKYDRLNPRTNKRPSVDGRISSAFMILLTIGMAIAFLAVCYSINEQAFRLSPIALIVVCGYSFTKRFTNWTHLFLGIALGISPIAAQVAMQGTITLPFVFLGLGVAFWVGGFDILYSMQDIEFDKKIGTHSVPARFGIKKSQWIARCMHIISGGLFFIFGIMNELNIGYFISIFLVTGLLATQHWLVRNDLSKIDAAFFTANGWISLIFLLGTLLGV